MPLVTATPLRDGEAELKLKQQTTSPITVQINPQRYLVTAIDQ